MTSEAWTAAESGAAADRRTQDQVERTLSSLGAWRTSETIFWCALPAIWFFLPDWNPLLNQIAIIGLFVLSLDLIMGYSGIISLGHAAFFGFGAYVAGLLTKYGIPDPLLGLLITAVAAALLGFISSFFVLRGSDLTRIMVTISVALILGEIANRMVWLTGGADGLNGIAPSPILGMFEFDLFGKVGAAYSLIVLFVLFLLARKLMGSPFGWTLRALKMNPVRAGAIGIPVNARLVTIYTIAAAYAGVAGALLAQTTQFVSLDVLGFQRSADAMLMLVIGGAGTLYGALVGAAVFMVFQDQLAGITPVFWEFWVGLLLVAFVLVGSDRIGRLPQIIGGWTASRIRRLRKAAGKTGKTGKTGLSR